MNFKKPNFTTGSSLITSNFWFKKSYRAWNTRKIKIHSANNGYEPIEFNDDAKIEKIKMSEEDASTVLNEMFFHINDAKIDLADKLLPLFLTLNNKLESKGFKGKKRTNPNNVIFINTLLEQANAHLDNDMYGEAIKIYPKISFIYQNLPKETQAEIYDKCVELHRRINNLN